MTIMWGLYNVLEYLVWRIFELLRDYSDVVTTDSYLVIKVVMEIILVLGHGRKKLKNFNFKTIHRKISVWTFFWKNLWKLYIRVEQIYVYIRISKKKIYVYIRICTYMDFSKRKKYVINLLKNMLLKYLAIKF